MGRKLYLRNETKSRKAKRKQPSEECTRLWGWGGEVAGLEPWVGHSHSSLWNLRELPLLLQILIRVRLCPFAPRLHFRSDFLTHTTPRLRKRQATHASNLVCLIFRIPALKVTEKQLSLKTDK